MSFLGQLKREGSTLARLVAGIGLVDHVDASLAADNLAVRMTLLSGFDGGDYFHKKIENSDSTGGVSNGKYAPPQVFCFYL
jgi:hypothetical protein